MGNSTLVYKEKLEKNLNESFTHLKRVNEAFNELEKIYKFPIDIQNFLKLLNNIQEFAFTDQIIYRFLKLQDVMGAKLFKALLFYQGENVDKPFLDILNRFEKLNILEVEEWFELREIRNNIAYDYEENEEFGKNILNEIYQTKDDLEKILKKVNLLMK